MKTVQRPSHSGGAWTLDRLSSSLRPESARAVIGLALLLLATLSGSRARAGTPQVPTYPDHTKLLVVRNVEGAEVPIRSATDWQVRRAHIVASLQEVMGPLPGGERRVPLDLKVLETIDEPSFIRKKVSYASEPGDRVPAWLLIPKSAGDQVKRPAMLCLHQTTAIGKDEPTGLGGKPNLHYAKELAERGYVVIAPDYPNFGERKVDPYALGYASASMKGIWDHLRAVDLLCSLDEVDPDRIGVIGHSLGGHNSIFVALFDPRIKAVVSSCGFNAFPSYYDGKINGWSHKGYMPRLKDTYQLDLSKVPFDFPELVAALAPRAFFTNSPTRDANFEVGGVKLCLSAAEPVFQLLGASDRLVAVYPDAEHDFPKAERIRAYEFLDRNLASIP
ncbi:alpha/beta hydrolase family protein [Singulisphaera acidiphila]|uniref:Prolyl oligopeptidase family protein n=1 Tax=Singulisphaera acidiphila (strain ATCC BAA-1392 / DSM 18658 / VKM B-2454 / MOB10) TaxID=886293 RepID=L0D9E9_SINAD|nr:alpha/beta fold hydrolase [Singulisphaera acidiphila]AGA25857.1 prolyl oligopeptidase family protein [Singulisphaera acidiphila DSM 18658]